METARILFEIGTFLALAIGGVKYKVVLELLHSVIEGVERYEETKKGTAKSNIEIIVSNKGSKEALDTILKDKGFKA